MSLRPTCYVSKAIPVLRNVFNVLNKFRRLSQSPACPGRKYWLRGDREVTTTANENEHIKAKDNLNYQTYGHY